MILPKQKDICLIWLAQLDWLHCPSLAALADVVPVASLLDTLPEPIREQTRETWKLDDLGSLTGQNVDICHRGTLPEPFAYSMHRTDESMDLIILVCRYSGGLLIYGQISKNTRDRNYFLPTLRHNPSLLSPYGGPYILIMHCISVTPIP